MGGECVVFAGWPVYGGTSVRGDVAPGSRGICGWGVAPGSRGICGVRAVYGRGMRGICGVAGLRRTSVRVGVAWYLQGVILQRLSALKCSFLRRPKLLTLKLITRAPFGLDGAPGCFWVPGLTLFEVVAIADLQFSESFLTGTLVTNPTRS